jgi:hypothetical protein
LSAETSLLKLWFKVSLLMRKDSTKKSLHITYSGILKLSVRASLPSRSQRVNLSNFGFRSRMHRGREIKSRCTHKGRDKESRLHGTRCFGVTAINK